MTFDARKFWTDPESYVTPRGDLKHICKPEFFLNLDKVTYMVTSTLSRYLDKDASIIELGCGIGRNLAGLKAVGFSNLFGVEINPSSIALGRRSFPLLEGIEIQNAAIEDVINELPVADCYFTQGVFMHLPPTSEWIFEVVSRKARKLIMTSEREKDPYSIAWTRDYSKIFAPPTWRQVEMENGLVYAPQLPETTVKRVFQKEQVIDESPDTQLPEQSMDAGPSPEITGSGNRKRSRKHLIDRL
jgi:SAM-dependent methyltransferase